ncbi:carotenoid biosynthesis protein [bacterium SCSIO 12741]|nr:carotenoid biosynthesis protein [bacterium SCSIO 12741]
MLDLKKYISIGFLKTFILLLLYGIGLGIKITMPEKNLWDQTWIILIISFALVYPFGASLRFHLTSLLIIILGFSVEWLGVHTGKIFGSYGYGENLGFKLLEVPPIIGLNWWIVVGGGLAISKIIFPRFSHPWMIAPVFLLFLDFFMEPLAPVLGFWHWKDGIIPLQNFIAWGIIGGVFAWLLYRSSPEENFPRAGTLYLVQLLFFGSLCLMHQWA